MFVPIILSCRENIENTCNFDLHTAVLDLGMSEEANGGLVASTPEIGLSKVEGIVEANNGVELLGKGLEVGL